MLVHQRVRFLSPQMTFVLYHKKMTCTSAFLNDLYTDFIIPKSHAELGHMTYSHKNYGKTCQFSPKKPPAASHPWPRSRSPALPLCFPASRPRWGKLGKPSKTLGQTARISWEQIPTPAPIEQPMNYGPSMSKYVYYGMVSWGGWDSINLYDANCNIWKRYIWLNDVRSVFLIHQSETLKNTAFTTLKQQRFRGEVSGFDLPDGITWYKHS